MSLGGLAFFATDVPVKNDILNGNFSEGKDDWYTVGYQADFDIVDGVGINATENTSKSFIIAPYIHYNEGDLIYVKVNTKTDMPEGLEYARVINGLLSTDGFTDIPLSDSFKDYSIVTTWRTGKRIRLMVSHPDITIKLYLKNMLAINLTETFGKGNEPTKEQMDILLEQFPNSWFDGTKNLFNAKEFINTYHKKITELENAIISLGGSD